MFRLLLVSLVWAFSFGLIKDRLTGVDPTAVATLRLVLALLVFLPFCRVRGLTGRTVVLLTAVGAVQFGAMYLLYLRSFLYLHAFEVALFTITTPVFVALLDAASERRFDVRHVVAALLSLFGAAVVIWQRIVSSETMTGVLLVQFSNLCFAAGQIGWRQIRRRIDPTINNASLFAFLYAGAVVVSLAWSSFTIRWTALHLTWPQVAVIVYLGILASGVCFFWWNVGATRVNAGTLAAFNNAKIPLAVACSLLLFGEQANLLRLLAGGALMAIGVAIAEHRSQAAAT